MTREEIALRIFISLLEAPVGKWNIGGSQVKQDESFVIAAFHLADMFIKKRDAAA
jgi:hypothetical protein